MKVVKHLPQLSMLVMAACISSAEAAQGTVEFFNESGGYGYVTDNETDETYVFETADITGIVQEGDAVTFSVTTEDDRFSVKAQAVALADAAGLQSASPEENDADDAVDDADATDDAADAADSADEATDDAADDSGEQAADAEEAADEAAETDDGSDDADAADDSE